MSTKLSKREVRMKQRQEARDATKARRRRDTVPRRAHHAGKGSSCAGNCWACMDALGGQQYFSTLDMRSGYWQMELSPEASEKTAFVTRAGVYKFNVLAFGLSNAP